MLSRWPACTRWPVPVGEHQPRSHRALSTAAAAVAGGAAGVALAVSAYADALLTWLGLLAGWQEANPIVGAAVAAFGWQGLMALKAALIVFYWLLIGVGLVGTARRGAWTELFIAALASSCAAALGHALVTWHNAQLLLGL